MSTKQNYLQNHWTKLWEEIGISNPLLSSFYKEITKAYQQSNRHYHNLQHLYHMLQLLHPHREELDNPQAVDIAIFYHDIIYQAHRKDNELQSANLSVKRLESLNALDAAQIDLVNALILATKDHKATQDSNDFYYLLDADLAILGAAADIYDQYARNVRSEYRIFPNFIYNPGRKKVLQHLLDKEKLYYTSAFKERFEAQAKKNLLRELKSYE